MPASGKEEEEDGPRPLLAAAPPPRPSLLFVLPRTASSLARVHPPPPPPTSASPTTTTTTPATTSPPKKVHFADQQPRPWCCTPAWWAATWRLVSSPAQWRTWVDDIHVWVNDTLERPWYAVLMGLLTAYSLFGDQVRLAMLPPRVDPGFRAMDTLVWLVFAVEMIALAWTRRGYFFAMVPSAAHRLESGLASPPPSSPSSTRMQQEQQRRRSSYYPSSSSTCLRWFKRLQFPSFYFWLDLLALGLFLVDVTFDTYFPALVGHGGFPSTYAARVGATAIRLIRVLKVCSILRLLKYLAEFQKALGLGPASSSSSSSSSSGRRHRPIPRTKTKPASKKSGDGKKPSTTSSSSSSSPLSLSKKLSLRAAREPPRRAKPSSSSSSSSSAAAAPPNADGLLESMEPLEKNRLATKVAESIHRKLIVGSLLVVAVLPFLLHYTARDTTWAYAFGALDAVSSNSSSSAWTADMIALLVDATGGDVVAFYVNGQVYVNHHLLVLRSEERRVHAYHAPTHDFVARVVQDVRAASRRWALESAVLSVAVLLLFVGLSASLHRDLARLVFKPLDQMIELVDRIGRNPLAPIPEAGAARSSGSSSRRASAGGGEGSGLEPTLLLQTIGKIGALVRIGLGEAGADIISRHMQDVGVNLDLRSSGKLVSSIFVFCDVRNFTDTTECLQEEVMLFVNKIAAILHELTVQCGGAPNKNVGDAFLLVWKLRNHDLDEEEADMDVDDPEAKTARALALGGGKQATLLAGQALYCVLKFALELSRLHAYVCQFSSAAAQRLFTRMPNYKVGVGFGLHVGWAVEGPIGSEQKIDVSYISPHVTTSEYLQDLTKEYGCTILVSEVFYHLLPPQAQYNCRQIDCLRRKGEDGEPMSIYTYDCDAEMMQPLAGGYAAARSPPPTATAAGEEGSKKPFSFSSSSSSLSAGKQLPASPPPKRGSGSNAPGSPKAASSHTHDPLKVLVKPYTPAVWDDDPDLQVKI